MKILAFGYGRFYQNRKELVKKYLLDNSSFLVGILDNAISDNRKVENQDIYNPSYVQKLAFDKIVIMSIYYDEMKTQLLELGIKEDNIWSWERFECEMNHGKFEIYGKTSEQKAHKKSILMISVDLGYNGGTIAITYAALILKDMGYDVTLSARNSDSKFLSETVNMGIKVVLIKALPYIGTEEIKWIKEYDFVLVNVLQLLPVSYTVAKVVPMAWWIHEPKIYFDETLDKYKNIIDDEILSKISVYAVSRIPQKYFKERLVREVNGLLPYGIPDMAREPVRLGDRDIITFAVIGGVIERKAQDIFVQAANLVLKNRLNEKVEFMIIGDISEYDEFAKSVRDNSNDKIRIMGRMTREQIYDTFPKIDVLVCPSREDPLPIVVTEGMMYSKVCIVSDATGNADLIEDKKSGLICKAGDAESLYEAMKWALDNKDKWQEIGANARKIYEEVFSMESFGERLSNIVEGACTACET